MIITDAVRIGPHGWADGINEPRALRNSLQQRAANVGAGCDIRPWCVHPWHDRAAASRALAAAAGALNDANAERGLHPYPKLAVDPCLST